MLSSPTVLAAAASSISATNTANNGGAGNNGGTGSFWASPPPMIDYGSSSMLPSANTSSSSYYSSLDYSLYAPSLHLVSWFFISSVFVWQSNRHFIQTLIDCFVKKKSRWPRIRQSTMWSSWFIAKRRGKWRPIRRHPVRPKLTTTSRGPSTPISKSSNSW